MVTCCASDWKSIPNSARADCAFSNADFSSPETFSRNGISSGWDWLTGKVKSLAKSLLDGAKDALGIHSPSRLFRDLVGKMIPQGIGVGITAEMPTLQSDSCVGTGYKDDN